MRRILGVFAGLSLSCAGGASGATAVEESDLARAAKGTPSDPPATPEGGVAAKAEPVPPDPVPAEPEVQQAPPPVVAPDGTVATACRDAPLRMSCVPGGPFLRGLDEAERTNETPQATVWLQTFYMDQYEVTYAEYKACQAARSCPRAGPRYTDFDHPSMPIQGVSWFDALAYCKAQGKTLPTEAQWEKAARGPDGERNPWGNEPATCERAIIKDGRGRSCGLKKAVSKPETGRPWDVGSRPVGRYGLYDMVGNSWEWVMDWYSRSYEVCGADCEGVDPRGPCGGADACRGHAQKIVRGGSWYWDADHATGTYRRAHFPANAPHFHHFGFRCAATVAQAEALVSAEPKARTDRG